MKRLNPIQKLYRCPLAAIGMALLLSAGLAWASGFSDELTDDPRCKTPSTPWKRPWSRQ